jgi:hypothetical protein
LEVVYDPQPGGTNIIPDHLKHPLLILLGGNGDLWETPLLLQKFAVFCFMTSIVL